MSRKLTLLQLMLVLGGCSVLVDTEKYRGDDDVLVDSGNPINAGEDAGDRHDAAPSLDAQVQPQTDAQMPERDAAPRGDAQRPLPDAGHDAGHHDGGITGHDASLDGGAQDAQVDARHPGDSAPDAEVPVDEPVSTKNAFKRLVTADMSSVVVNQAGHPLVFYHGQASESNDLGVVACNDKNHCTSTDTIPLDVPNNAGIHPHALIDRDGLPVVAYQEGVSGQAKFLRCDDAQCNTSKAWVLEQGSEMGSLGLGQWSAITLSDEGFPLVSYYDARLGDLRATMCERAECCEPGKLCSETSANPPRSFAVTDQAQNVGKQGSVQLGADGIPVFSYYDETAGGLGFARCRNARCTGVIDSRVIDSAGATDVGQYTAMVRAGDGLPLIFYFDATSGDLKAAKCNDAACSAPDIHVVDGDGAGPGVVGQYAAAVMPADGLAVVSYYDAGQRDLKVAKCSNESCSRVHTHRVAGASTDAGEWTSIALIPGSELPVISYVLREAGKPRLMLAFCGNTACYYDQPDEQPLPPAPH